MTALPHMDITIDPSTGEILDSLAEVGKGIATETDLILPPLTVPEWAEGYRKACTIGEASNWWQGAFLDAQPGPECSQYITDSTADQKRWVYRNVHPNDRRPELSWSHHRVVAARDAEMQRAFLAKAVEFGLSVNDLIAYCKAYDDLAKGKEMPEPSDKPKVDARAVLEILEAAEGSVLTRDIINSCRYWLAL